MSVHLVRSLEVGADSKDGNLSSTLGQNRVDGQDLGENPDGAAVERFVEPGSPGTHQGTILGLRLEALEVGQYDRLHVVVD